MFKIKCWYNPREYDIKNTGVKTSIRCSNCGKEKMIDVDILDTTYQYIIRTFVLNTMLHRVGMLWIIETHEQLKMIRTNIIQNRWQVVPGITNLFVRNYMEKCLRDLLEIQKLTDIISCVLLLHMKNSIDRLVVMAAAVGVVHYHQIQQQEHYIRLMQL